MSTSPCHLRRSGHGRPVVFFSGCPTPWDLLAPFAEAISQTHEAIELALPGFGASPALVPPYTLADELAAVEATLMGSGIEECALVGFSGAVYHAFAIATRGKVRVTGIYSLSGLIDVTPEEAHGYRGFAAAFRAGVDLHEGAVARFLSPDFAARHPEARVAAASWLDAALPEVIANELEVFAGVADLAPALGGLDIPVVARVGELDLATPRAKSEAIVNACPRGRLEVVAGAGHALVLEDVEGTMASMKRFLGVG